MTTFKINSKDSPPTIHIRVTGAIPVSGSTCRLRVDTLDGGVIVVERVVIDTIVVSSITYFEVRLTLAESDLLVPIAGKIGIYLYTIQVESTSLPFRQEVKYILQVSEHYVTG